MKILILHRVPYDRIDYGRGIDHHRHDVTYFGTKQALDTLPADLRHRSLQRAGKLSVYEESVEWHEVWRGEFDRIISLSEYELLDAAKLREKLRVPGATMQDTLLVRDKVLMKQAVAKAEILLPRFERLRPLLKSTPDLSLCLWEGPTVLKPHSGASSEDVVVFPSFSAALHSVKNRKTGVARLDRDEPELDLYEMEEFVAGHILHFDGLLADGVLLIATASRYVGTCLGFAQGAPLGSYHIPLSAGMRAWVVKVLAAVGLRNGSFHLEAIETNAGLVFLEVGNRVGGADVVQTFEMATGVHLPSEELRILLGEQPSRVLPVTQTAGVWYGWFVFPGHTSVDSVYSGLGGVEMYREDPDVIRWVELAIGCRLSSRVTYSAHEAPLAGIVACHHHARTADWLRGLFSAATSSAVPVPAA